MRILGFGRYGTLATVLAVLLVGLGTVALVNSIVVDRTAQSMGAVNGIARHQAQPQVILAQLQLLRSDLSARRYLGRGIRELDNTVKSLDMAVSELQKAATQNTGTFGFSPLAGGVQQKSLTQLKQTWSEYRKLIAPVLNFKGDAYVETADQGTQLSSMGLTLNRALEEAANFGTAQQASIGRSISDLTASVETDVKARAAKLRTVSFAGLAACVLLALGALIFLRVVSRKERNLGRAKQESDAILRTVNQGLFLLDSDLKLGSERSEALENIFRRKDFDQLQFADLLRGIVPDKTLETAAEYVRLLWGERVNEKLIKTINPLNEVEVSFDAGGGKSEVQYLEFDFNRVRSDGGMSRILVTVNDVTRRVELARELHDSQEKAQAQLDLLLHILHVDPLQLSAFLEESEVSMKMVNSILKEPAREESAFRSKIDGIFRQVHSVKGEAAALGLKSVEQRAHNFEESLSELRSAAKITGNDFLPLVVKLDELFSHFAQVREMIGRLSDLRVAMSNDKTFSPAAAPQPQAGTYDHADAPGHASTQTLTGSQTFNSTQTFSSTQTLVSTQTLLEAPADAPRSEAPRFKPEETGPGGTLIQRPSEALELLRQNAEGGDIAQAITQLAERIAHKQSKKVSVNCSGLERVPNKYRRALKDIAIQMVRNSLAHGIETPQERARQSKATAGSIVVRFEDHGEQGCEFVCQDDGRGLTAHTIKAKALEKGLITKEQAAALDERAALSLIFLAGFSTQDKVTNDAGRGVGMDIVRAKVIELGGKLGISTTAGKFLRFRIWLPAESKAQAA